MSDQRATLEIIAPTIEEAIAKGVEELGLSEGALEVEVLDDGSKGLLGIGSRQARVRLTVKDKAASAKKALKAARSAEPLDKSVENAVSIARETVSELLDRMDIQAEVSANLGENDDPRYRPSIIVDINGNDLSILIGQRAETLNALQFITRMIVGKEIGQAAHIVVDVEGYRTRRETSLRRLARQMAEQATGSGRRQTLEPMPANERRIIHLELHDNPDVVTESIDQEPRRKVTISPVEN
jgi:spoIIIJ-associated protein